MTVAVNAVLDLGDVERSFRAALRRGKQLGQAFRVIRGPMRQDQRDHADQEAGPDGSWPARKAIHRRGKGRGRRVAKRPLGRLVTAVNTKVTSHSIVMASKAWWSGVHQEGGKVGHGATVPQRTFLWISDRLLDKANEIVTRLLLSDWGS